MLYLVRGAASCLGGLTRHFTTAVSHFHLPIGGDGWDAECPRCLWYSGGGPDLAQCRSHLMHSAIPHGTRSSLCGVVGGHPATGFARLGPAAQCRWLPQAPSQIEPRLGGFTQGLGANAGGLGAQQLNVFLDGMIAYLMLSHRPGAVTILYMANRLLQLPMALISGGVGTVIYPDLARAALTGWAEVGAVMRRGTTVVTALLLPASVGLWLCAESLVITIFRSGAFSVDDAERTIFVTQFIAVALLPLGYYKLLIRALNAGRQERKPMRIALVSVVVNTTLNLILVQTPLYEAGLALASLISGSLACGLAALSLRRLGTGALLEWRRLLRPVLCTGLMAAALIALLWYWPLASSAPIGDHVWRLGAAVGLGVVIYGAAMGPKNLRALGR